MTIAPDASGELLGWVEQSVLGAGHHGLDLVEAGLQARATLGAYRRAVGEADPEVVVAEGGSGPLAAALLVGKPMETDLLGVRTASITDLVAPARPDERPRAVRSLLDAASRRARERSIELTILRVDSSDVATLDAAQAAGFRVCEATVAWLAGTTDRTDVTDLPDGLTVEVHEGEVSGVLDEREVALLAERTAGWQLNHFRADPRLPASAVERFYRQWVHNIADGSWSDCLLVARREGRLVGIQSEVTDRRLLRDTGVGLRMGEWIVVLEHGVGAGRALMATVGRHHHPGGHLHLWETQLRNLPIIRCIERSGVARPVRTGYTLHGWTSDLRR